MVLLQILVLEKQLLNFVRFKIVSNPKSCLRGQCDKTTFRVSVRLRLNHCVKTSNAKLYYYTR